jgi:hypothetical protein
MGLVGGGRARSDTPYGALAVRGGLGRWRCEAAKIKEPGRNDGRGSSKQKTASRRSLALGSW